MKEENKMPSTKFVTVPRARLPFLDAPGTIAYTLDTREVFLYCLDGKPAPVSGLMNIQYKEQPGRDGRDGKNGTNGVDGKQGPRGEKGEPGSILVVDDAAVQAAYKEIQQRRIKTLATIQAVVQESKSYPHGARVLVQNAVKRIKETI